MPMRAGFLGSTPALVISGDLDHSNSSDFVEAGLRQLRASDNLLFIDLSQCLYVDSGGLGGFFTLLRSLRPHGSLGVIGANRSVAGMIRMVGLLEDPSFHLFADQAAVEALLGDGAPRMDAVPLSS